VRATEEGARTPGGAGHQPQAGRPRGLARSERGARDGGCGRTPSKVPPFEPRILTITCERRHLGAAGGKEKLAERERAIRRPAGLGSVRPSPGRLGRRRAWLEEKSRDSLLLRDPHAPAPALASRLAGPVTGVCWGFQREIYSFGLFEPSPLDGAGPQPSGRQEASTSITLPTPADKQWPSWME
jgi:hypothetical protein